MIFEGRGYYMEKILHYLDEYLEEILMVIFLIAMTLIMGIQVFSRYVLGKKVPDYPPLQEIQQCGRPYGVYCSDGGANQSTDCRTSARDYETSDRRGAVTGTGHI